MGLRFVSLVLLVLSLALRMSAQRTSYDPAARDTDKKHDSFVYFTLKQINSQNIDYGCKVGAGRKLVIDETIKSIDFWTFLITFSFLVLSFFMLVHQHRERERREIITSGFLTQYHNALVDANKQVEALIGRYNELVNAKNRATEAELRVQTLEPPPARTATESRGPDRDLNQSAGPAKANVSDHSEIGRSDQREGNKAPIRHSVGDLLCQISTLQQQLNASHEREKRFEKELKKAQRRGAPDRLNNSDLTS